MSATGKNKQALSDECNDEPCLCGTDFTCLACHFIEDDEAPILPHGIQPTEQQWQVAEALDDLVSSKGVILDDDRLHWLVGWVAAREDAARVDEREKAIDYLRRFPPTDRQRPGIEAALVWLLAYPS